MNTQPARAGGGELADSVRAHADDLDGLSLGQRRVLNAIAQGRTATLGGHRRQCEACGHEDLSDNSCRNRHCPTCQGLDEARWVEAQQGDLLPVQYCHIVFTVPTEVHARFLTAPSVAYTWLFIHCIVPGGSLALAAPRWVPARRDFFLPVRVLSQVFRGKRLSLFEQALDHGTRRGGRDEEPRQPRKQAARKKWVVHSTPSCAGAEPVLAYLGRYA